MGAGIMWKTGTWKGMEGGGDTIFADDLQLQLEDEVFEIQIDDEELILELDDQDIVAEIDDEDYILEVCLEDE